MLQSVHFVLFFLFFNTDVHILLHICSLYRCLFTAKNGQEDQGKCSNKRCSLIEVLLYSEWWWMQLRMSRWKMAFSWKNIFSFALELVLHEFRRMRVSFKDTRLFARRTLWIEQFLLGFLSCDWWRRLSFFDVQGCSGSILSTSRREIWWHTQDTDCFLRLVEISNVWRN